MQVFDTLRRNKTLVILMALVGIVVAIGVTLVQPFEYRTTFSVLVIEKGNNQDAFTAAKSAERLSLSLGQIIYTTSFYDKVMHSKYMPNSAIFPNDDQQRRAEWKRRIDTRVMSDIGQMKISVYDRNSSNATALANALAMVLSEQGTEYLGGSDGVTLKVVDYPLTSKRPARPNIPFNLLAGFLLGGGAATGYLAAWTIRRQPTSSRTPEIPYTSNEATSKFSYPKAEIKRGIIAPSVERVPVSVEQPNQYMFQNQYGQVAAEPAQGDATKRPSDDSIAIHTLHDQYHSVQTGTEIAEKPKPPEADFPEEEFRNFE
ncbi:MAG: Wzz/FepE/Etk N-terminal domain-containing protein [Patescibacteria group bacterium]|jgi:capsular polysaccharide biosynthesis protein